VAVQLDCAVDVSLRCPCFVELVYSVASLLLELICILVYSFG
jgi:hypothetical protein